MVIIELIVHILEEFSAAGFKYIREWQARNRYSLMSGVFVELHG